MEGPETFDNITNLTIKHGGSISISEKGVITGVSKATKTGITLTLFGTHSGGGMTIVQNNGFVTQTFSHGFSSGTMVINGREIDLSRLDEIAVNPPLTEAKTYQLSNSCKIACVTVIGSASLLPIPLAFTTDTFNATVQGNGDIFLPSKHFQTINISLSGSGDITGDQTIADTATINLAGSGDVRDIHIVKSGVINLMGSGDIRVSAENPKNIAKNKMGSGSIKIKSQK